VTRANLARRTVFGVLLFTPKCLAADLIPGSLGTPQPQPSINDASPILPSMPTVLRILGFRFHFYSDEGTEPPHIHVESGDSECKFWLAPVALAKNRGMSAVDIRRVERLVYEHQTFLLEAYDDFQSQ
jgi:hypothetical protein